MYKQLVTLACIAFGLFWAVMGWFRYTFWVENGGPGGGFFPVIVGGIMAALALVVLVRDCKKQKDPLRLGQLVRSRACIPPLLVLFTIGLTEIVGMLPAVLVLVAGWLVVLEKMRVGKALLISGTLTLIVYGVFSVWLKVPFPLGLFEM